MQFQLRTIFLIVTLFAVVFGANQFLEVTWFAPARTGVESQVRFNQLVAENKWEGMIAPTHYLQDVKILINDVSESEIRKLYPILHDIDWLRHICIHSPAISRAMLQELRSEFPRCTMEATILER